MNDVLLSPLRLSELENLIEKSVLRALNQLSRNTAPDADPYGDFKWLIATFPGIPTSTLRIKSAAGEIPGVVKFGKRVLYDKATVLSYLRSQTRQTVDIVKIEQAADSQVNTQLLKQSQRGRKAA